MNHKKSSHFFRSIAAISLIILALALVSNCKKGVSQADLIVLTISQPQWGLNYSSSMGHVEIFLQGDSVDGIILGSIEMKGDNPSAAPLKADSADFVGANRVRALFEKNRVLALLANPSEGSIHIVIVCFKTEPSGESFEVSTQVTVSDYVEDGETSSLTLEIDPVEWSLNFTNSAGTVEAFIRGEGINQVDLNSLEMVGDNPDAAPLPAVSTSINNDHIHARFAKNQVIGLLLEPAPGTAHTIIVSYLLNGGTERMELSAIITIEEEDDIIIDPTDLTLEIDPVEWSLNFTKSSGTVEAFIRGEGFDQIDLSSIEMTGDNPAASPLAASSASISGDHVHARFPKNQVIALLLNPEPGSTHTITISFLPIGGTERIELTAEITIEDDEDDDGGDDGDDPEPSDLTLQLNPSNWNMNYAGSSGTVTAKIQGTGIEDIDLATIEMAGDNPAAEPLSATSAKLSGNHINADFPKNKVLDLLLSPAKGTRHTVTVSFMKGGKLEELTAEVKVK
jgi:hypothetical protein